ncbi:hypothetical protein UCRPA7_6650 [Phaeoacremonium minimum UCRPA7]|uniref:Uncharacterized protein n=1 Tax=Phaeoacremonium minimum (strain UCR-PA7) TaxID=1286976 RepID=R8BF06_PHAM7|nr:hypothetical protein UCRPA7_6650 [Phaeoacremonium minimum UCRPA7]EON97872.1 hypothetical protein UCRPA7_6650 [Phaeoacremonium minimum UCRPA7]
MDFSTLDFDAFGEASWHSPTAEKTEFGWFDTGEIPIDPSLLTADQNQFSIGDARQVPSRANQEATANAFKTGFNGNETLTNTESPKLPVSESSQNSQAFSRKCLRGAERRAEQERSSQMPNLNLPFLPLPTPSPYPDPRFAFNVAHPNAPYFQGYPPPQHQLTAMPPMPSQYVLPPHPIHFGNPYPQQPYQFMARPPPTHRAGHHLVETKSLPIQGSPLSRKGKRKSESRSSHYDNKPKRRRGHPDVDGLYEPLPAAPERQGPIDEAGKDFIKYDRYGEILPYDRKFTRDELRRYLWWTNKHADEPGVRPPTLWIQAHPAMCNKRYPRQMQSFKCRMASCPVKKGTIFKGMWQVGIDEFPDQTGAELDPFHMAGHCHLWCIEREFDLFDLIQHADVRPDDRHFKKEARNPMSLLHNEGTSMRAYTRWYKNQQVKYEEHCRIFPNPVRRPRRTPRVEDCLWHWLTMYKLREERVAQAKCREQREAEAVQCADLHIYKGDLEVWARLVERRAKKKRFEEVGEFDDEDWEPTGGFSRPSEAPSGCLSQEPKSKTQELSEREGKRPETSPPVQDPPIAIEVQVPLGTTPQPFYMEVEGKVVLMVPHHTILPSKKGQAPHVVQAPAPAIQPVFFDPDLSALPGQNLMPLYQDQVYAGQAFQNDIAGVAPVPEMYPPLPEFDMGNIGEEDMNNYIDAADSSHQQLPTPQMALLNSPFDTQPTECIEVKSTPKLRRSPRHGQGLSKRGDEGRSSAQTSAVNKAKRERAESQGEVQEPRRKRTRV